MLRIGHVHMLRIGLKMVRLNRNMWPNYVLLNIYWCCFDWINYFMNMITSGPVLPKSVLISLAPTLTYSECWYLQAPSLTKWVLPSSASTLFYSVLISPTPSAHIVSANISISYPPAKWEIIFHGPILHIVSADIPCLHHPTKWGLISFASILPHRADIPCPNHSAK